MKLIHYVLLLWVVIHLPERLSAQQNSGVITGTVKDSKGETLPGVSVSVKGTSTASVTNTGGEFKIAAGLRAILVFRYVGFETQELVVTEAKSYNIVLQQSVTAMDEVVVIGYGTQRKSSVTGAVSKLNNENLNQIPVARADQALAGKLAGVQVQTTDAQAGAAPLIKVRGAASVTAGTNPL